ncbi:hypothetical protein BVX98_03255, partial [bacterium F11]
MQVPTATVTFPTSFMNGSQTTINGTAEDNPSGITLVEIAISSDSGGVAGSWYNGVSFSGNLGDPGTYMSTTTYTGGSPDSWTHDIAPALTQGNVYSIVLRTTDGAGNVRTQTLDERETFKYDEVKPTVSLADPDADYERALDVISGGSSDGATFVTGVEVSVSTGGGAFEDFFWNGSGWQVGSYWFAASAKNAPFDSGSEEWQSTNSTPTWVTGITYKVKVKSTDQAGNESDVVSSTFTFDLGVPTVSIHDPNDPAPGDDVNPRISTMTLVNGRPAVRGATGDNGPAGVNLVEVRVRSVDLVKWYNNGNGLFDLDDGDTAWFNAVTTDSWANWYSTMTLGTDARYRVNARSYDTAGNMSVGLATSSFVMDQDVPESDVQFPGEGSYVRD